MCDGAVSKDDMGYNGTDTNWGRYMAGFESFTFSQCRMAYNRIQKYHRQLENYGLWPAPAMKEEE
jgi:hypothetical protein